MASIKKYATAKGHAWRVQYRSPDGRSRTKQGFPTKSAAQAWADKNAVSIREQDWISPTAGRMTVEEIGTRWLATQTHLKPSTGVLAKTMWESTVEPMWGTWQIANIRPSHVQEWVATMGKSGSWVRQSHAMLAQILDVAVADRIIRANPARGVKLPRKGKAKKVYLTMAQLMEFADECGDRKDLIMLLGTSGLRWGEATALRPMDLDPLRNRIEISRAAVRAGSEIVVGSPKTHEARVVAVAPMVMEMLVERSMGLGREDLLWTGVRGGWLRSPSHKTWFFGALRRCQERHAEPDEFGVVGEPFPEFSPHGLRHVAAGLLIQAGANVKVVQRQLGHKSAAMTLDQYADLWDGGLDEIATVLDAEMRAVAG